MSQCQKMCDCEAYDSMGDHRAALIKMELPEYDESYGGTSYTIFRAIRFIGYVVVLVLLSYSLWRIHVIESTLVASDRFANVSKIIALGKSNALHRRVSRSVKGTSLVEQNGFEFEKELARGGMLTSKNETPLPPKKKVKSKEEFNDLVNSLFDAIQKMHNDTNRSHFDRNMKTVFQAWFPVFDALLPSDLTENNTEETRNTRSADRSSQESSEENKDKHRISRDVDKSSQESSEEKKDKQDKPRQARSLMYTSDESSEERTDQMNEQKDVTTGVSKKSEKKIEDNKDEQKSSEASSEENNKNRRKRSFNANSGESSESNSSESHEDKQMHQLHNRVDFSDKGNISRRRKYEEKSSESSESSETSEESSNKNKNGHRYSKV